MEVVATALAASWPVSGEFQDAVTLEHLRKPSDVRPLAANLFLDFWRSLSARDSHVGRHWATNCRCSRRDRSCLLLLDLLLKILFLLTLDDFLLPLVLRIDLRKVSGNGVNVLASGHWSLSRFTTSGKRA